MRYIVRNETIPIGQFSGMRIALRELIASGEGKGLRRRGHEHIMQSIYIKKYHLKGIFKPEKILNFTA